MSAVDYGREALDFIEGLGVYRKVPDAMNALEAAFGRFGFETIIVTGLPNPDQRFAQMVLAKRWPAGWFNLYTQNNYDRFDPVVRLCRQSVNPFEWSEAPYDAELEPSAAEVMNRAGDFRMSRGFIVPIHGLTGYEAAVSLGGVHLDLNPRSKPALHLMAMYGFDHIRRLLDPTPYPSTRLTPREREVISWASQGKSAWEIGEILHITQRTAEEHLATAARKLGAVNRTHAVALAIRHKIINP
ncbi:LuxR family quorum sensing-dependent transcriptional regulator [Bradyrhizobium diazoefficiens]|uniref:Transcriptional regulatory protein n=1 Tax=Bradyrhizobium diazoefficiens TaxID=1355477 RepID=A0A0E3VTZ6_9BRAD|nr:LuxR family transcriptional regulator [Bradyrhizobium diazoefficiens]MBR0861989.1 autoinducer binding domain-containing protein [Bradyrhizobium diazoefficiens]MBR0886567.1 autoinducer binding domain-containing protein [Bradyrhizobium diazoefficiens]MBR0918390.1 autoinducer binding domain-containing protein [Bradyrhizobium diazoefficiens]WLA65140.1 LuxR family transcriptional regulator [Bradyrhizobium diazoefficiens]BAR56525.1 transcriptional regulatory protein [Bradyrhizobium diazoefficiens